MRKEKGENQVVIFSPGSASFVMTVGCNDWSLFLWIGVCFSKLVRCMLQTDVSRCKLTCPSGLARTCGVVIVPMGAKRKSGGGGPANAKASKLESDTSKYPHIQQICDWFPGVDKSNY